jgi:ubiquitin-protein ligase
MSLGLLTFPPKANAPGVALSSLRSEFESALEAAAPGDKPETRLWDTISAAADALVAFNPPDVSADAEDDTSGGRLRHVKSRILVLSDGEDTTGQLPIALVQRLIAHRIVVDGLLVSTADENAGLRALCSFTGGCAFRCSSEAEGRALFAQEAFICYAARKKKAPWRDRITPDVWAAEAATHALAAWPARLENHAQAEARLPFALATPICAVNRERALPAGARQTQTARLCRELAIVGGGDIEVWVNCANIRKIRVFFQGPPESPHAGVWWSLFATLPPQYPQAPPVIRFVNVPLHPNVSPEGRAVFSIASVGYKAALTLREIFLRARILLPTPEEEHWVNADAADMWKNHRDEYANRAQEQARLVGKRAIQDFEFMSNPAVRLYRDDEWPSVPEVDGPAGIVVHRSRSQADLIHSDDEDFLQ